MEKEERISYKSLIKAILESGGTITPIEALRDFGLLPFASKN